MFNPSAKAESNFEYELSPEGPTVARCARVIEIGVQETKYGNQKRCVIVFSLPKYFIEINGEQKQKFISQPFGIHMVNSERGTMFQYVKALNPQAESLGDFLNRPCQLNISHYTKGDGRKGERIDSVSALLPEIADTVGELDTEPFWFQWDNPDPVVWAQIPPFTKNLIQQAVNFSGSKVEQVAKSAEGGKIDEDNTDDLPF